MSDQFADNNYANQLNPNNPKYWKCRGYKTRPDNWEELMTNGKHKLPLIAQTSGKEENSASCFFSTNKGTLVQNASTFKREENSNYCFWKDDNSSTNKGNDFIVENNNAT